MNARRMKREAQYRARFRRAMRWILSRKRRGVACGVRFMHAVARDVRYKARHYA